MKELTLSDIGGVEIDPREIITDELIGYVESLNPTLGSTTDPYYKEYQAFLAEIASAGIATIDMDSMSNGRFDDIDLTGNDEEVVEVLDSRFTFFDAMLMMSFMDPFSEADGDYLVSDEYVNPYGEIFKQ